MTRLPHSRGFSRPFFQLVAVAAGGLLSLSPAFGAEKDSAPVFEAIQREVQTIFAKCRSAVVRIEANDQRGYLSGTGFFIDPNGTLYTSYTIGGESQDIQVAFGGKRYQAQRLVSDMRSGIAILKIDAETPFLTFGDSRQLGIASPVIAIGYPMDLALTPAFGTVGGFDLKYQGRLFATTHIRANIPVQRGEGGAPLLNTRGEAVGILISKVESGNASYVLPIEAAEKVRKDFVRFHEVRPGWIGVKVKALDSAVNGSTAAVDETIPDAPGEKAGLRAGDVILQVGAHHITCPEDVVDASFFLSAEDQTVIRVVRDGSEQNLNVTPTDNPDLNRSALPTFGSAETPAPVLKIGH
jgi:S1-C subfamily serine protease